MSELLIVLQREFIERVRTKSFILSTILTPLFIVGVMVVPMLASSFGSDEDATITVVDESGLGIGAAMATLLAQAPGDGRVLANVVQSPIAEVREDLVEAVGDDRIDGFVHIPADVMTLGQVEYQAESVTNLDLQGRLRQAATEAVRGVRIRDAGISQERLALLLQPVGLSASRLTRGGAAGEDAAASLAFSFLVGFALYFVILLYGAQVMQSVQEEKTNRIAEVLVSSIRAPHLMLGKALGVGMAALVQVAIWATAVVVLASQRERLAAMVGGDASEALDMLSMRVDPLIAMATVLFAVLGFFMYAAIFATAGAAAASSEDAQRFTFPIIIPLIIPIMLGAMIVSDPAGTVATVLGWVPLTSPLVMPMRIGTGAVGTAEIFGALGVLALSVYLVGVLAGKIYRIGILSTGKRPTLGEIIRWTRIA